MKKVRVILLSLLLCVFLLSCSGTGQSLYQKYESIPGGSIDSIYEFVKSDSNSNSGTYQYKFWLLSDEPTIFDGSWELRDGKLVLFDEVKLYLNNMLKDAYERHGEEIPADQVYTGDEMLLTNDFKYIIDPDSKYVGTIPNSNLFNTEIGNESINYTFYEDGSCKKTYIEFNSTYDGTYSRQEHTITLNIKDTDGETNTDKLFIYNTSIYDSVYQYVEESE